MDLPDRSGAGGGDAFELIEEPLRISVMSTGLSPSMYRITIEGPYPQPESFEALAAYLRGVQVGSADAGVAQMFEADHPIIIQPTRSARPWTAAAGPSPVPRVDCGATSQASTPSNANCTTTFCVGTPTIEHRPTPTSRPLSVYSTAGGREA